MSRENHKLTEELIEAICRRVRDGVYPHVAAEAEGIPAALFDDWLTRYDRKKGTKHIFLKLRQQVRKAQGEARSKAEILMHRGDPKVWLLSGPGKDDQGPGSRPGWTQPTKTVINANKTTDARSVNVLLDPTLQNLFAGVLEVLTPFPEAREAVAQMLLARGTGRHPALPAPTSGNAPLDLPAD